MKKKQAYFDRRSSARERIFDSVNYTNSTGALRRGELLNLGRGGARLITSVDLEVGSRFTILHRASPRVTLRCDAEVRWTKLLPCGLRQVVGVREIDTSIMPNRSRSTVRLG